MLAPVSETKKVDLSTFDNTWYKPGGTAVVRFLWYFINILFFINPLMPVNKIKVRLLKLFGAKIGRGVVIKPGINIKFPWHLQIGNHTWIGEKVWIDNLAPVYIGDHVTLSQGAMLLTGNHNYKTQSFDLLVKQINIEEGVWIGSQAIVCPGVTCRSHSILSVGSVATQDLEPYYIYQGNPAEKKRPRILDK